MSKVSDMMKNADFVVNPSTFEVELPFLVLECTMLFIFEVFNLLLEFDLMLLGSRVTSVACKKRTNADFANNVLDKSSKPRKFLLILLSLISKRKMISVNRYSSTISRKKFIGTLEIVDP